MSNTILIKRSSTAGEVPSGLTIGELAIDVAEGKLYYGNSLGTVSGLIQQMYMTVAGSPPPNPKDSALWFQTDVNKLFVYHSSTWHQTGGLSETLIGTNDTTGNVEIYTTTDSDLDQVWADGAESATVLNTSNYVDIIYPIGSIIFSNDSLNPDARFPDTTWEPVAEGRFIASVGTYTDVNAEEKEILAGDIPEGEYNHTLTVAEMPAHTHQMGNERGTSRGSPDSPEGAVFQSPYDHNSSQSTGGDGPHNNIPPGWAMYVWERTA